MSELCEGLVGKGNIVTVVTAQPSYLEYSVDQPHEETINGVKVIRTSMSGTKGRNTLVKRISGYIRFLFQSWFVAKKELSQENYDVVITLSNPPFVGVLGALISKVFCLPYLCVIYDIHPEIVRDSNWISLPRFVFKIWNQIMVWVTDASTKVVVLSERMKETVSETKSVPKEKIEVIPIWATPELLNLKSSITKEALKRKLEIPEDSILILSAGNIGIMQPADVILNSAEKNQILPLHFLFVGGGTNWEEVVKEAKRRSINNITFIPYQPAESFKEILSCSDVCIVSLGKGFEKYSVPSRAFTFLSAGKPIIALMERDSDISDLVISNHCGWHAGDENTLDRVLELVTNENTNLSAMGDRAKEMYLNNYRKDLVISSFDCILSDIEGSD